MGEETAPPILSPGGVDPKSTKRDRREVAANVLLSALLVFVVRPEDWTDNYLLGAAAGSAMFGLAVGWVAVLIYRKGRGQPARWTPWILVIAIPCAIFSKVAVNEESRSATEGPFLEGELDSQDAFVPLAGFTYESLPPEELESLERQFTEEVPDEAFGGVSARYVNKRGRFVGMIMTVEAKLPAGGQPAFERDFVAGFSDQLEESNGEPVEELKIGGRTAPGGENAFGYGLCFVSENLGVFVYGEDRATAVELAEPISAALPD